MPRDYTVERLVSLMYSPSIFRGIQYMNRRFRGIPIRRKRMQIRNTIKRAVNLASNPYNKRSTAAAVAAGAAAVGMINSNANRAKQRENFANQLQIMPNTPSVKQNFMGAPVALSRPTRSNVPKIMATNSFSRIRHREFIANITGSSLWAIMLNFPINPGMSITFPWLSTQAGAWEFYHFNSLEFQYVSRTNTSVPGAVALIPDYDAADGFPPSEVAAANYQNMVSDVVWNHLNCPLKSTSLHPNGKKYIRTTGLGANLDIKTYDAGNIFVACSDGTTVPWGKLWVEYDVTLSVPNLVAPVSLASAHYHGTSQTTLNQFNNPILNPGSSNSLVTLNATGSITFNVTGQYLIVFYTTATTINAVSPSYNGPNLVTSFANNVMVNSTSTILTRSIVVSAIPTNYITLNDTYTGGGTWDFVISQLPTVQT